jgi:hypothetical protein
MFHSKVLIRRASLAAAAVTCLLSAACARPAAPATTAAKVERTQCVGVSQDDVALLQGTAVLRSDPIYTRVMTKDGSEKRISGVKLIIRPADGMTADRLTRTLQCHSARALLGQVDRSQLADDPYVLADEWLDIQVGTEDGNLAVSLQADSVAKNLQVFNRATAYADSHGAQRSANP